jgi:hypothetical protein
VVYPEFTIRLPGGTTWCRAWVTVPGTDGESTVRFVSSNRSAPRILHDHSPRCYAITGAVYPCTEPPTRPIDAQGGRLVCWVAQDHSQFYTVRRYPRLTPITETLWDRTIHSRVQRYSHPSVQPIHGSILSTFRLLTDCKLPREPEAS